MDLYEYEASVDGGGEAAAPEPAAEAVETEAAEPIVNADPGDEQQGYDPAAVEAYIQRELDDRLAALQYGQQYDPPIAGATPGPMSGQQPANSFDWSQIDPYGEDFGAQLGFGIQQTITQALGDALSPLSSTLQQQAEAAQLAEGEQRAQDIIADAVNQHHLSAQGQSQIRPLAEQYMNEFVGRYGETPRAAEAAIYKAAQEVAAYETALKAQAVEEYKNQIATLAGAQDEPGIGATSTMPGTQMKYTTGSDFVSRFARPRIAAE